MLALLAARLADYVDPHTEGMDGKAKKEQKEKSLKMDGSRVCTVVLVGTGSWVPYCTAGLIFSNIF